MLIIFISKTTNSNTILLNDFQNVMPLNKRLTSNIKFLCVGLEIIIVYLGEVLIELCQHY